MKCRKGIVFTWNVHHNLAQDQCCCIPADQDCFDLYAVDDLVGQGLIDPRHQETELDTRIVNRPPAQPHQLNTLDTCPASYKTCCYAPDLDLSVFQVSWDWSAAGHNTLL